MQSNGNHKKSLKIMRVLFRQQYYIQQFKKPQNMARHMMHNSPRYNVEWNKLGLKILIISFIWISKLAKTNL